MDEPLGGRLEEVATGSKRERASRGEPSYPPRVRAASWYASLMRALALLGLLVLVGPAIAQDLVLEGEVAEDAVYFELPFVVPEGVVELEVRGDDLSDVNILDWGVRDPERVRGWGGGNTEPAVIGAEAASRSYLPGPLPAGEWAVLVGAALVEERPARYRVEVFFRDAPTLAPTPRTPYIPASALGDGPRWFAGDFHVHTRESGDAAPTLDEAAAFAVSRGLDFIALTEHNVVSHLDLIADVQARHPSLLLLPGIEITTYDGHANALGVTEWVDFRVRSGLSVTAESIADAVDAQGGLFTVNHPALRLGNACLGCAWDLELAPRRIAAVEVQNGAYSTTGIFFFMPSMRFWDSLLATGAHVAAIGGSDDHRAGRDLSATQSPTGSPTTMVYARELSVAAILEGVRAGRTVVKLEGPEDPMVELFAGDALVGDTVDGDAAGRVTLRARITGATAGNVRFFRNGSPSGESVPVDADPFEISLEVEAPSGDEDDRWRVHLDLGGRPVAITSHVWVRATGLPPVDAGVPTDAGPDEEAGGCGCASAPQASAWLPMVAWLFWRRRAA